VSRKSDLPESLNNPPRRLELGDVVLFVCITAVVRQYFWPISNGNTAWAATILVSLVLWIAHFRTKQTERGTPSVFWLVVGGPLLFFYAIRAALPDMSWDVLDYRIINGELGLAGWPIRTGDFFPSRFPFNPAPDMVMGIGRKLLGYRLGTIINLSVLIWTGTILEKICRRFIGNVWLRCVTVLILLLTEHLLFEVNNYMVDLLALPLLLEASRLSFTLPADSRSRWHNSVRIGLYLGAALTFKLTNLAFVIPVLLVMAHRFSRSGERDTRAAIYGFTALLLPLLPYSLFIYWQTGNPVFPLFNGVFGSSYWPIHDLRPERWGPVVDDPAFNSLRIWERLIWPILLPFRVAHTAGDIGPHWGRVTIGFMASLAVLSWRGADKFFRMLAFVTSVGAIIWSMASGMLRYAGYVEVVGGLMAIYLIAMLLRKTSDALRLHSNWGRIAAMFLIGVLVIQSASSCVYAFEFEWGGRPNLFRQPYEHLYEARFFFRDHAPAKFLSDNDRSLISSVDVWVESAPMTGGLQTLLRPEAPLWCVYMDEFFQSGEARETFARVRAQRPGPRIYTLALNDWLPFARDKLSRAGFQIGSVKTISLPYYSDRARFHTLLLIELPELSNGAPLDFDVTAASGPLPHDAYSAALSWARAPQTRLRPGERSEVRVVVSNTGNSTWPALGHGGANYRILAGNHWLDARGQLMINDDARAALPFDLAPGRKVELPLLVTAPRTSGAYVLEIDMLQENVSWFSLKGSSTLRIPVTVTE
jgi:hypothetical protein